MHDLRVLVLRELPHRLAVCRLGQDEPVPDWCGEPGNFLSITRTGEELSIICDEAMVPSVVSAVRGFRAMGVVGPLEFSEVGVLTSLAGPLADAQISVMAVSTFDTDFLLVREERYAAARSVLEAAGHHFIDQG